MRKRVFSRTGLVSLAAVSLAVFMGLSGSRALGQGYTLTKDGLHGIEAFKLNSGGGSNDHDLNNTAETKTIWDAIDGGFSPPGVVTIGSKTYNVQWWETDTENRVIYNGNYDGFTGSLGYATINGDGPGGSGGSITGGDDFSVRARTYMAIPQGTWSISAGSDDGRYIDFADLDAAGVVPTFTAQGNQVNMGGTGNSFIGYNNTTGHNHTTGVFTIGAGDLEPGTNIALVDMSSFFFELGGGDNFHLSIKPGSDTGHGGTGDGWALLQDGTFGWAISSTPITINYATPGQDHFWIGGTGNWTDLNWEDPENSAANTGTFPTGGLTGNPAIVPAGTVNVTGAQGAFSLNIASGTIDTGGTVDVNAGATLTVQDNTDIGATGTLDINGTFHTFIFNTVAGSAVNLNNGGSLSYDTGTIDTLNVTGTGTLIANGNTITNLNMNSQLDSADDYTAANTTVSGVSTFNQTGGTATVQNVGGSGDLAKSGGATVILNTANSYSGQTTVNAGILQITNGGALGDTTSGTVVNNGGQLRLSGGITTPTGEPISINGGGSGGAIYNLSSDNNIDGPVSLAGGSTIRVDNNRLRLRGGLALGGNALQINTDGGTAAEINSNPVTGTGTLTKEGDGTLDIRVGSPAYAGQINVNNGVLDTNSGLGTGSMNIDGDATLRLRGNVDVGKNITLNGTAGGGTGEGAQGRIRNDDNNNTLSGTIAVNSNSRIDVDGGTTLTLSGNVTGSGNIEKTDSGTLVLSGNNSFSGNLSFPAGTLRLESDNALGAAAGAVNLSGGATMEVQGGVNVGAKPVNLADSHSIVNLGGANTVGGNITLGPAGSTAPAATIDTQAGSLVLGGNIDMNFSNLTVTGAGDTVIQGVISGTNTNTQVNTPGLLAGSLTGNPSGGANPGNFGIVTSLWGMWANGGPDDAKREAHWRGPRGDSGSGPNNTTLIYTGQVNLDPATGGLGDASGVTTFIEQNDDRTRLYLDGGLILSNNNWNDAVRATFTPAGGPGWYDFEVRFSNGGGGYGFFNQTGGGSNWNLADSGFRTAPGVVGNDDALNYTTPVDPGDGSVFRYVQSANPNDLVKDGSGTLTLEGDNTYVGTTDVLAGTLLVNGTTSGQGDYTVHAGATLGGTGSIGADVNFLPGSFLTPGTSIGTLTVAGDLGFDATYQWELSDTAADLTIVGGDLALGNWTLEILNAGISRTIQTSERFDLFTYDTLSVGVGTWSIVDSTGLGYRFSTAGAQVLDDGAGTVYLTGILAVVPEPGTLLIWSLLAALGLAAGWRRRRK